MEIVLVLLVLLVAGGVALRFLPRGRRSGYDTVEDRPAGRD